MYMALDFTSVALIEDDLFIEESTGRIEFVQSVWIDNSTNGVALKLLNLVAQQSIVCPPNAQGMFPMLAVQGGKFRATTTQGVIVPVIFLNIPQPYFVWKVA